MCSPKHHRAVPTMLLADGIQTDRGRGGTGRYKIHLQGLILSPAQAFIIIFSAYRDSPAVTCLAEQLCSTPLNISQARRGHARPLALGAALELRRPPVTSEFRTHLHPPPAWIPPVLLHICHKHQKS